MKEQLYLEQNFSCYLDSLDVSLEMTLENESEVQVAVSNSDPQRAAEDVILTMEGNGIDIQVLPVGCSEKLNAEIECRTGLLTAMGEKSWTFPLAAITGTGITVMAQAEPYQAADVFSADNSAQLDIRLADDGSKTVSIVKGAPSGEIVADAYVPPENNSQSSSAGAAMHMALLLTGWITALRKYVI